MFYLITKVMIISQTLMQSDEQWIPQIILSIFCLFAAIAASNLKVETNGVALPDS